MADKIFKLYGFFNRKEKDEFSFVVPIYQSRKCFYRCDIDDLSYRIVKFNTIKISPENIDCEDFICCKGKLELLYPIKKNDDPFLLRKCFDLGIYSIRFNSKYYVGSKIDIYKKLFKLLRYECFKPIDKFSIFTFLEITSKVNESINTLIDYYSHHSVKLTSKNFYVKAPISISIDSMIQIVLNYSNLIRISGYTLNLLNFFSYSDLNDKYIFFNRFRIKKSILKNKFLYLKRKHTETLYADMICFIYAYYELADVNKFDFTEFRISLLDIPIKMDYNRSIRILLDNSQSYKKVIPNAAFIAKKVDDSINYFETVNHKDKDYLKKFKAMVENIKKLNNE